MISAYSYIRFSSAPQEKGDSIRRQEELRDAWLKRHRDVKLDTKFEDRGVSGYRGKHRTEGDLGRFLSLVTEGRIARGSYLIVENLDRLTRENPWDAVALLCGIVNAGIKVVTLTPSEMECSKDGEITPLIMACVEFGRGNSESKRKAGAVGQAKVNAKKAARETGRPMGKMAPAWLELVDGKYRVKEDAGKTVRLIYRLCAEGSGVLAITQKLNTDKVTPIGRGAKWVTSYVAKILDNRATIGEYQPMSNGHPRTNDGDPIPNYYPPVVTIAEFHAALKAREGRTRRSGRPAKGAPHLFSGLLWCARDNCPIYFTTKGARKYLISSRSVNGETGIVSFPMKEFQEAVLSQLREIRPEELFSDPGATRVAELTARLSETERKLDIASVRWEADPESKAWGDRVTQYDRESRALKAELIEAQQQLANPTSASWADIHEADPRRLRAALLRTIERVYCVTAQRGEGKLLACEIHFKDSDKRRKYLIHYLQAKGGFAPREASYTCRSLAFESEAGRLDFTQSADVAALSLLLEVVNVP